MNSRLSAAVDFLMKQAMPAYHNACNSIKAALDRQNVIAPGTWDVDQALPPRRSIDPRGGQSKVATGWSSQAKCGPKKSVGSFL
jgi:hypothetical protein